MEVLQTLQPLIITFLTCATVVVVAVVFKSPLSEIIARAKTIWFNKKKNDNSTTVGIEVFEKRQIVTDLTQMAIEASAASPVPEQSKPDMSVHQGVKMDDIFEKLYHNEPAEAERMFLELQNSDYDRKQKVLDKGNYLYFKYRFGHEKDIQKYRDFLADTRDHSDIQPALMANLAYIYEFLNQDAEAFASFTQAADSETIMDRKAELLCRASAALKRLKGQDEAVSFLLGAVPKHSLPISLFRFHRTLYEILKDTYPDLALLAYEKALSYVPNDKAALFDFAYNSTSNLAKIYYYGRLLSMDESHRGARNNLGVAYASAGLPFSAIES